MDNPYKNWALQIPADQLDGIIHLTQISLGAEQEKVDKASTARDLFAAQLKALQLAYPEKFPELELGLMKERAEEALKAANCETWRVNTLQNRMNGLEITPGYNTYPAAHQDNWDRDRTNIKAELEKARFRVIEHPYPYNIRVYWGEP